MDSHTHSDYHCIEYLKCLNLEVGLANHTRASCINVHCFRCRKGGKGIHSDAWIEVVNEYNKENLYYRTST